MSYKKIEEFKNKILNCDCLDVMRKMPNKSIDLVLTDPPYGIGESNEKNLSREKLAKPTDYGHYDWDNKIPDKEVFNEIFRISKNQIIFGGNYFVEYLKNSSCWLVWDKDNGNNDFADCELCWTSFKTAVRKYKYRWQGMLQEDMKNKDYRWHPTQKPIKLIEKILLDYTEEGNLILDCFAGSGTTGVAAQTLKRNFILIEQEEKYCEIIRERLRQQNLF